MIKPKDPRELAIDLLPRSICRVQVAAVIADAHGIFSWGWNSVGNGDGEHAEAAAIRRSSRHRLRRATIYIASRRKRNKKMVCSKPCPECWGLLEGSGLRKVCWLEANGVWMEYWL